MHGVLRASGEWWTAVEVGRNSKRWCSRAARLQQCQNIGTTTQYVAGSAFDAWNPLFGKAPRRGDYRKHPTPRGCARYRETVNRDDVRGTLWRQMLSSELPLRVDH